MTVQQLKIDIGSENGITDELYDKICELITNEGLKVMDDANGPYTEDMTEIYKEQGII